MHFEHPYAASYRRYDREEPDGTLKSVLEITASIDLANEGHSAALQMAAVEYAKNKSIDVIEFAQGPINNADRT